MSTSYFDRLDPFIIRLEMDSGEARNFIFCKDEDENLDDLIQNILEEYEAKFVELMRVSEFVGMDFYEVCTP